MSKITKKTCESDENSVCEKTLLSQLSHNHSSSSSLGCLRSKPRARARARASDYQISVLSACACSCSWFQALVETVFAVQTKSKSKRLLKNVTCQTLTPKNTLFLNTNKTRNDELCCFTHWNRKLVQSFKSERTWCWGRDVFLWSSFLVLKLSKNCCCCWKPAKI